MTTRELIEALQEYPEDAEVLALDENDYAREITATEERRENVVVLFVDYGAITLIEQPI